MFYSFEAEWMSQPVKCLKHTHENPSLGPQHPQPKLGLLICS